MRFDFDTIIPRRGTHSSKWDNLESTGATAEDAIAMWVADMDFIAAPAVTEALREEVERACYGYYAGDHTWREAMAGWLGRRHQWDVDPDWITPTPGIGSALGLILQAYSEEGDAVVVFSPVYHAFFKYIKANGREVFAHKMETVDGAYRMDLERLAETLPGNAKVVFFCSPHNPGGKVWCEEEITALADFCVERDLVLVSDEIHHDLVYPGRDHAVTQKVAPHVVDRLVTCAGATKTFNLAGAHVGGAIIPDENMRKRFRAVCNRSGLLSYSLFGMIATEAAQRDGDAWLDALLPYLQTNRDLFHTGIEKAVPGASAMPLEATYLAWVDFSGTGLPREDFMRRIAEKARIGASPGPVFGPGGETHMRFNFATPRSLVAEALERLDDAFADLR